MEHGENDQRDMYETNDGAVILIVDPPSEAARFAAYAMALAAILDENEKR